MLWGTTGTAQALAPAGAHPMVVGTMRLVVGGLTILVVALMRGGLQFDRSWPLLVTLAGGLTVAGYQLCFFAAVDRTGVAVGTIVAIGSSPVMAGLLDIFLERRPPGSAWYMATAMAVAGCILLTASGSSLTVDTFGVLLALGAGLTYAIYTLCSKRLLVNFPPDTVMAVIFCLGALFLSPALFRGNTAWLITPRGIMVVLHLGIITTGLSYIFYARGLKMISVSRTVTLSLAEPLTAGLLGILLLGEQLTLPAIVGVLLLFGGLVIVSLRRD
jgi:drug/metabolite transporter, DME family